MKKEYFLEQIKEKYPDNFSKYDYSLLPDEFKAKDNIEIKCLTHGIVFRQSANSHQQGSGCSECGIDKIKVSKLISTDEWISRARIVHGDRYDYSKTIYTGNHKKVIITCKKHGDFIQISESHIKGFGCSYCSGKRVNTEEFIKNAKKVHGDTYGYDKVVYVNNTTEVIITCKVHGDIKQKPNHHLLGFKCVLCRNDSLRSSKESFIRKAKEVHGDKYDYADVDYVTNNIKVKIYCKKHSAYFLQTPGHHLNGRGCKLCKESHGEKYISFILDKLKIKHEREYRVEGYSYKYDFYLTDYHIYLEYHGVQHYEPAVFFGGKKHFRKQKKRDKAKIELIKRSNGLLIVIKYTFNTMKKLEEELLRLFGFIHPEFLNNSEKTKQAIIDSKAYLINDGRMYKRK